MNPTMRKVNQPSVEENSAGPMTGGNFKSVDPSVKKILCPALGLPNEVKNEVYLFHNKKKKKLNLD